MSRALNRGEYFGAVEHRFDCAQATVSAVAHRCSCSLPEHDHGSAYFGLLLRGTYVEQTAGRDFDYRPFDVAFHPPGVPHRDAVGESGARFLCLEIKVDDAASDAISTGIDPSLLDHEMSALMLRLHGALVADALSPLIVDSVAWELVGAVRRMRAVRERRPPAWLARCAARVREDFSRAHTMRELAGEAGVHPVHVSREFRKRYGQTVGEYAHKARVRAACVAMEDADATLADIAARVGFADQAHFCRVFRATVGVSPSTFRASIQQPAH